MVDENGKKVSITKTVFKQLNKNYNFTRDAVKQNILLRLKNIIKKRDAQENDESKEVTMPLAAAGLSQTASKEDLQVNHNVNSGQASVPFFPSQWEQHANNIFNKDFVITSDPAPAQSFDHGKKSQKSEKVHKQPTKPFNTEYEDARPTSGKHFSRHFNEEENLSSLTEMYGSRKQINSMVNKLSDYMKQEEQKAEDEAFNKEIQKKIVTAALAGALGKHKDESNKKAAEIKGLVDLLEARKEEPPKVVEVKEKKTPGVKKVKPPTEKELLIQLFREALNTRGARGFISLKRQFRLIDSKDTGCLSLPQFLSAFDDLKITIKQLNTIPPSKQKQIFLMYDHLGIQTIKYQSFLDDLVPDLSNWRVELTTAAFELLDANHNGELELDEIQAKFTPAMHPDVLAKLKSAEEARFDFFNLFTSLYCANRAQRGDDQEITIDEFVEYHKIMNTQMSNDKEFRSFIVGVWSLKELNRYETPEETAKVKMIQKQHTRSKTVQSTSNTTKVKVSTSETQIRKKSIVESNEATKTSELKAELACSKQVQQRGKEELPSQSLQYIMQEPVDLSPPKHLYNYNPPEPFNPQSIGALPLKKKFKKHLDMQDKDMRWSVQALKVNDPHTFGEPSYASNDFSVRKGSSHRYLSQNQLSKSAQYAKSINGKLTSTVNTQKSLQRAWHDDTDQEEVVTKQYNTAVSYRKKQFRSDEVRHYGNQDRAVIDEYSGVQPKNIPKTIKRRSSQGSDTRNNHIVQAKNLPTQSQTEQPYKAQGPTQSERGLPQKLRSKQGTGSTTRSSHQPLHYHNELQPQSHAASERFCRKSQSSIGHYHHPAAAGGISQMSMHQRLSSHLSMRNSHRAFTIHLNKNASAKKAQTDEPQQMELVQQLVMVRGKLQPALKYITPQSLINKYQVNGDQDKGAPITVEDSQQVLTYPTQKCGQISVNKRHLNYVDDLGNKNGWSISLEGHDYSKQNLSHYGFYKQLYLNQQKERDGQDESESVSQEEDDSGNLVTMVEKQSILKDDEDAKRQSLLIQGDPRSLDLLLSENQELRESYANYVSQLESYLILAKQIHQETMYHSDFINQSSNIATKIGHGTLDSQTDPHYKTHGANWHTPRTVMKNNRQQQQVKAQPRPTSVAGCDTSQQSKIARRVRALSSKIKEIVVGDQANSSTNAGDDKQTMPSDENNDAQPAADIKQALPQSSSVERQGDSTFDGALSEDDFVRIQVENDKMYDEISQFFEQHQVNELQQKLTQMREFYLYLLTENTFVLRNGFQNQKQINQRFKLIQLIKKRQNHIALIDPLFQAALKRQYDHYHWFTHSELFCIQKKVKICETIVQLLQKKNLMLEFYHQPFVKVGEIETQINYPMKHSLFQLVSEGGDYLKNLVLQTSEGWLVVSILEREMATHHEISEYMVKQLNEAGGNTWHQANRVKQVQVTEAASSNVQVDGTLAAMLHDRRIQNQTVIEETFNTTFGVEKQQTSFKGLTSAVLREKSDKAGLNSTQELEATEPKKSSWLSILNKEREDQQTKELEAKESLMSKFRKMAVDSDTESSADVGLLENEEDQGPDYKAQAGMHLFTYLDRVEDHIKTEQKLIQHWKKEDQKIVKRHQAQLAKQKKLQDERNEREIIELERIRHEKDRQANIAEERRLMLEERKRLLEEDD